MSKEYTGERIRGTRCAKQFTQTQLAAMIGAHTSQVSDWERGKLEPGARYLRALCTTLGVSADYLLGLTDAREVR